MTKPAEQTHSIKTIPLSEKHLQKLAVAHQTAEAAIAAANQAQAVANEKKQEAQRAAIARRDIVELVFDAVGAPMNAQVDFEKQVIVVPVEPEAPKGDGEKSAEKTEQPADTPTA